MLAFHVNLPDPEERVGLGEEGGGVPGLDELHLHPLLLLLHVQIIQVGSTELNGPLLLQLLKTSSPLLFLYQSIFPFFFRAFLHPLLHGLQCHIVTISYGAEETNDEDDDLYHDDDFLSVFLENSSMMDMDREQTQFKLILISMVVDVDLRRDLQA